MIRDFVIQVSEWLFWMQGGEMMVTTIWFFPWVVFWSLIIAAPLWLAIYNLTQNNSNPFWMLATTSVAALALIMAMGPTMVQQEQMSNCRSSPPFELYNAKVTVTECQTRTNRFKSFGEWRVTDIEVH